MSNIDLHYFAGPHKNNEEPSAQAVPTIYNTKNFISPYFPFERVLKVPAEMKVTIQPTIMQVSHPVILFFNVIDLHKLSFLVVFSAISRAALAPAGYVESFLDPPMKFFIFIIEFF